MGPEHATSEILERVARGSIGFSRLVWGLMRGSYAGLLMKSVHEFAAVLLDALVVSAR